MSYHFQDRAEAGRQLAERLQEFSHRDNTLVLGLPRGGIPVAAQVARGLGLPLGALVVRKFGAPRNPDQPLGAVSSEGAFALDYGAADACGVSRALLYDLASQSQIELNRSEKTYYALCPEPDVHERTVLLVDDGIATGSTMLAAKEAVLKRGATRVVIAAPVVSGTTFDRLHLAGHEVIAVIAPTEFQTIGEWFHDFRRTTDEEALQILKEAMA